MGNLAIFPYFTGVSAVLTLLACQN